MSDLLGNVSEVSASRCMKREVEKPEKATDGVSGTDFWDQQSSLSTVTGGGNGDEAAEMGLEAAELAPIETAVETEF